MKFASAAIMHLTSKGESRILRKLHGFADLRPGWNHGDGMPISHASIARAEELLLWGEFLELQTDVFPNPEGGCAVAFYKNDERVEVEIDVTGNHCGLTVERGVGFQYEDVIEPIAQPTFDQIAAELIPRSRLQLWTSLESLTSVNLTARLSVSAVPQSRTPQRRKTQRPLQMEKGGSLSLMSIVPVAD